MQEPYGIEPGNHIKRAAAPYWFRHGGDASPEDFGLAAARDIETKILEAGADTVAAVFVEPIQATMGAIIPPDSYFPEVERICRKHGVLLVADEVVTGLGRTGKWFAQETFGFNADIMTLAKGLSSGYAPISAVVMHDDIADVVGAGEQIFQHGFTTSAHPVMAAIALRNLDIIEEEGLIQRIATDIGPYFDKKLQSLKDCPLVGEVRTKGLMAGIELVKDKKTREQYPLEWALCEHVNQAALLRGIITRPTGNALVLCPPYILTHAEVNFTIDALKAALNDVYDAVQQQT